MRRSLLLNRMLLLSGAILALGVVTAACGSSKSSSNTATAAPSIAYETPTPGSAASPSSAASSAPSSAATSAPSSSAGASATTSGTTTGGAASTTINITAKDTAFDLKTITVPAGQKITVNMTNDDKLPHNFGVYDKKDGTELFTGSIFSGPNVSKTETFTAPATAGNYYFQCDVHPTQMFGTLVVQ